MSTFGRILKRAALKRQRADERKRSKKNATPQRSAFYIETLESRLLLSADVLPVAANTTDLLQNNTAAIVAFLDLPSTVDTESPALTNANDLHIAPALLASDATDTPEPAIGVAVKVEIPKTLQANPGETIPVPVLIDDATDIESVDIIITYDTTIFDVANSDVKLGTLTGGGSLVPNVNDQAGTITIALALTNKIPAGRGSGSLFIIDFHVKDTAPDGQYVVDLRSISLNEDGIIVTPRPITGADPNDGLITIPRGPVNSISINDVTLTEGDSGSVNAVFNVTLNVAGTQTITVQATTANGTATAGQDYTATGPITVSFAPGETSKQVSIPVLGDLLDEANETFFVNLTNATNATISDTQGQGTINDNDPVPAFSINDVQTIEGDSGTKTLTFTVTKTGLTALDTSVQVATADDTATAGSDYVALALTTLNFAAGETSKTVDVTINGDTAFEPNETFFVNLSNATNGTISDAQGVGTITNNDPEPVTPDISINDVTLTEGDSGSVNAVFNVTLNVAGTQTITVQATTANGTATAGQDYTATGPITVSFAPGETSKQVSIPVLGDLLDEANETFFVNLTNATNATISDTQGQGTINDNDPVPAFSINDVQTIEGDSGTKTLTFTVTKTGLTALDTSVQVATADDTATAGSDYVALALTTLNFAAGETSKTVDVTINGDTAFEPNETFFVNLSNATNGTISDAQGVGTITNNDPEPVTPDISINDVTLTEGDSGSVNAVFNVTLNVAGTQTITVQATTANGTATAGQDYTATGPITVSFAPGETSKQVSIPVLGDLLDEANETFFVNLTNATNATISDTQGQGTINDNDPVPAFSINDVQTIEGDSGTKTLTFTVTKTGLTALDTSVQVATADDTATAGSDYVALALTTLNFAAGETSKTVDVTINGDTAFEPNETFFVNLSNATNGTISDAQGVGTITNNDPEPVTPDISINDVTLTEGDSGSVNAVFNVTLNVAGTQTITVQATTANGTATAGQDYTATGPITVSFAPGETSKQVSIPVLGDLLDEANETFFVNLTNATNATISDTQGQGTINDNDPVPAFSINDVQTIEGDSGTKTLTFTVTKTGLTALDTSVQVATADDTATAGSDYVALALTTLNFAAGETSKTVDVTINGDTAFEPNETFFVNLSNATNGTISDAQGVGTITNNDPEPVTPDISINDVTLTEGDSGSVNAVFNVTLNVAGTQTITVQATTANGTATAGQDYTATGPITVSFAPGETSKQVSIPVLGDLLDEANETFFVNLTNATNATISDTQGQGTINDNDPVPAFSINDVQTIEGDSGTKTLTFTVTKTGLTALDTSVQVATADDTATAGSDYVALALTTLNFAAGETSKTVDVTINGDTAFEPNETFFVNLSNATNGTISDAQGVGTITNNDQPFASAVVNIPRDISGLPGSTVTLPVNIDNALGLESVDLQIGYDPSVFDVTNVRLGSATTGGTLVTKVDDSTGLITVALALSVPHGPGGGSLVLIDFHIKPTATGGAKTIDLRSVSINEGGIPVTPQPIVGPDPSDGTITVIDLPVIMARRNTIALPGDPADIDGDGFITILDARKFLLR